MAQININKSALVAFITKAKQNTYASIGEGGEKILADGSKELVFKEGDFKYRDRYFGFNPFAGQEVIFLKAQAIWAMNYYGMMTSKAVSAAQVYQFLKQALSKEKIFYKDKLVYKLNYHGGRIFPLAKTKITIV